MPASIQALLAEDEGAGTGGSLSDELDDEFGSTIGALIRRGLTEWELIAPGTLGYVLTMGAALPDWAVATGGSGGYTFSSSAPVGPTPGDRWVDSDTGILYTFVDDGSSTQWVEF